MSVELSIIVPAYNETKRLVPTLARIVAYMTGRGTSFELIVVDDGSNDDTVAVAESFAAANQGVRVLAQDKNRGKGAAVRAGMLAAKGKLRLFSDADLSTPIEEVEKLEAAIEQGADIAIASRAIDGADIQTRQHPAREFMGRSFNYVVRALAVGGIKDTQCGFKLFSAAAADDLFGRATVEGFAFDVEILMLAKGTYRVAEVPVIWRHMEESKVSPGVDAARMFVDVVRLRLRHLVRRR